MFEVQVSHKAANLFTGSESLDLLWEDQLEALLLFSWPQKHEAGGGVESGISGLLSKYEHDKAVEGEGEAIHDAELKHLRDERRESASGPRTDEPLRRIDALALKLEKQQRRGILNPRCSDWREELAAVEQHYIEDPAEFEHEILSIKIRMMSKEEKAAELQKLALRLYNENITAVPPLVWGSEADHEPDLDEDPNKPRTREEVLLSRLGFVFIAYRADVWFWEAMERLHMFLMTAGLVFIYPDSPAQTAAGAMISFVFLIANLVMRPYCTEELNFLKAMSLFAQFITLFSGIMIGFMESVETVGEADKGLDHAIITVTMVLTNLSVVLIPLLNLIISGEYKSYKRQARTFCNRLRCRGKDTSAQRNCEENFECCSLELPRNSVGSLSCQAELGFVNHAPPEPSHEAPMLRPNITNSARLQDRAASAKYPNYDDFVGALENDLVGALGALDCRETIQSANLDDGSDHPPGMFHGVIDAASAWVSPFQTPRNRVQTHRRREAVEDYP